MVANPGNAPQLVYLADALAGAGLLGEYFTGSAFSRMTVTRIVGAMPTNGIRRVVDRNLRRRQLPSAIETWQTPVAAGLLDVLAVLSFRSRHLSEAGDLLLRLRNDRFDRAVSRRLRRNIGAFVGTYTACLYSLIRAKRLGIRTFLDYPVAHHRYAESLLGEEARLSPDYAGTLQFHRFPPGRKRRMDSEIELVDTVIVLSSFQERTFLESGVNADKLVRVPLGVDSRVFRPGASEQADRPFRVVFVGQITQRKGISYLVEAFEKAALPQSELVLVGQPSGTVRPWSSKRNVRHVPHVPRWELPDLYRAADVFVLPSLIEGFPQTALEAMACGLPVVVSENTFGSDVVTDGIDGFIVPIRDAEAIADRLRILFNCRDLARKIGIAARLRAQDFSWSAYGDRVVRTLQRGNG